MPDKPTSRRPLRVGVQLPEIEREVGWSEMARLALLAEQVGFDSVWLGDHLLYRRFGEGPRGPWEAWTVLAALGAITERVALGPLVACTAFHAPAMLAKKAVGVDEISGGRLILGLGAGWNEAEFEAFGFPFDHRVSRFEEAFSVIRRLVRDEEVTFEGAYHTVRDCRIVPAGPRPGGPPIMIGSTGERMLAITAPYMDMWNAWYAAFGNRVEGLSPLLERVDAACVKAGRDPSEVARTAAVLVQLEPGRGRLQGQPDTGGSEPIRGHPAEIAERLGDFADAGIHHVQLVVDPIDAASIEALGQTLAELDT